MSIQSATQRMNAPDTFTPRMDRKDLKYSIAGLKCPNCGLTVKSVYKHATKAKMALYSHTVVQRGQHRTIYCEVRAV